MYTSVLLYQIIGIEEVNGQPETYLHSQIKTSAKRVTP